MAEATAVRTLTLEMTLEEAHLLIRAVLPGLRGSRAVSWPDPCVRKALDAKVTDLLLAVDNARRCERS